MGPKLELYVGMRLGERDGDMLRSALGSPVGFWLSTRLGGDDKFGVGLAVGVELGGGEGLKLEAVVGRRLAYSEGAALGVMDGLRLGM